MFFVKEDWDERVLLLEIKINITKTPVFLQLGCEFEIIIVWNIFTYDVNFPVKLHYLICRSDVINVKSFHEILRYLFQILATRLEIYMFYLSRDLETPLYWGVMHIYKWERLAAGTISKGLMDIATLTNKMKNTSSKMWKRSDWYWVSKPKVGSGERNGIQWSWV